MTSLANRHRRQIEMPFPAERGVRHRRRGDPRAAQRRERGEHARQPADPRERAARGSVHRRQEGRSGPVGWVGAGAQPGPRHHARRASDTATLNLVCEPEGGAWLRLVHRGQRHQPRERRGDHARDHAARRRARARRAGGGRRRPRPRRSSRSRSSRCCTRRSSRTSSTTRSGAPKYLTRSDPARAEQIIDNLIPYLRHSLPRADDATVHAGRGARARARLPRDHADPHGRAPRAADPACPTRSRPCRCRR